MKDMFVQNIHRRRHGKCWEMGMESPSYISICGIRKYETEKYVLRDEKHRIT